MPGVWVYAELGPGGLQPSALELLTKARTLGGDVAAVALGPGATEAARSLGEHGATKVFASDDAAFDEHLARRAVHALAGLIEEHRPDLLLVPTSHDGRDVAGRLQGRIGSTLVSNASDVTALDRVRMQIFGDTAEVEVALEGSRTPRTSRSSTSSPRRSGALRSARPARWSTPGGSRIATRSARPGRP